MWFGRTGHKLSAGDRWLSSSRPRPTTLYRLTVLVMQIGGFAMLSDTHVSLFRSAEAYTSALFQGLRWFSRFRVFLGCWAMAGSTCWLPPVPRPLFHGLRPFGDAACLLAGKFSRNSFGRSCSTRPPTASSQGLQSGQNGDQFEASLPQYGWTAQLGQKIPALVRRCC